MSLAVQNQSITIQNSKYDPQKELLILEPINVGKYKLICLLYDELLESQGLVVNKNISTITDNLVDFNESNVVTFKNNHHLYFGTKTFEVDGSSVNVNIDITISSILSAIKIDNSNVNPYVLKGIKSTSVSAANSISNVYSKMSADGIFYAPLPLSTQEYNIGKATEFYAMPSDNGSKVSLLFNISSSDHNQESNIQLEYKTHIEFISGARGIVKSHLDNHPLAKMFIAWMPHSSFVEIGRPRILQDNEHHTIYANPTHRNFYINELVQIKTTADNKFTLRSYSPQQIEGISVWAKSPLFVDDVLIFKADTLAGFADLSFDIPVSGGYMLTTRGGYNIEINSSSLDALKSAKYEIESEDPYWKKLLTIMPTWRIQFNLFGADPTKPGKQGAAGNWLGIRPVHAREAIVLLINLAYGYSQEKFWNHAAKYVIKDNNGKPIDQVALRQSFNKSSGYNIGVVTNVAGLGGGRTLGITENHWINHYDYWGAYGVFAHEQAHCLGYSHASDMTQGNWVGYIVPAIRQFNDLPIRDKSLLNSANNPRLYFWDR